METEQKVEIKSAEQFPVEIEILPVIYEIIRGFV